MHLNLWEIVKNKEISGSGNSYGFFVINFALNLASYHKGISTPNYWGKQRCEGLIEILNKNPVEQYTKKVLKDLGIWEYVWNLAEIHQDTQEELEKGTYIVCS